MWLSNNFAINTIPFNEIEVKTIFVFQPQGELLYFIHFCIGFGDRKPESTYMKISTGNMKIILLMKWLAQVFMLNIFLMSVLSSWLFLRVISFGFLDTVSVATCILDLLIFKKWEIICPWCDNWSLASVVKILSVKPQNNYVLAKWPSDS